MSEILAEVFVSSMPMAMDIWCPIPHFQLSWFKFLSWYESIDCCRKFYLTLHSNIIQIQPCSVEMGLHYNHLFHTRRYSFFPRTIHVYHIYCLYICYSRV
jgi:hypothetical protein